MRFYPWNMSTMLLTLTGLMALGVAPPLGIVLLLTAFVLRRRFVHRVHYWEKIYDAKQAEREYRERIAAIRRLG